MVFLDPRAQSRADGNERDGRESLQSSLTRIKMPRGKKFSLDERTNADATAACASVRRTFGAHDEATTSQSLT